MAIKRDTESYAEAAKRVAVDAVYEARDSGGVMHDAGEAAANAAIEVVRECLENFYHPQNPLQMHPADAVTKAFELDGHDGLRYV